MVIMMKIIFGYLQIFRCKWTCQYPEEYAKFAETKEKIRIFGILKG